MILDLDKEIFDGIFAKDILDNAVKGSLQKLLANVMPSRNRSGTLKIPGQSDEVPSVIRNNDAVMDHMEENQTLVQSREN